MNLHHFPYFTQPKKSAKKKFQLHSVLLRSIKKFAHAHNIFFGFWFFCILERSVDEIKNGKSKIILKLPHPVFARYHRIFIFLDHPNYAYIYVFIEYPLLYVCMMRLFVCLPCCLCQRAFVIISIPFFFFISLI